jgi:DNA-binding transcriptional ArsR family regulator
MFEIQVVSNTPLTAVNDVDEVALRFLSFIGYLPKGYDPKTEAMGVMDSVPYRLFMECFMRNMKRAWMVEELSSMLETTKPTIYRHINKLKAMDLLEAVEVERDGQMKKGYRIRYGDLKKAWSFTEANVEIAMQNYRASVEHFQEMIVKEAKG